MVKISQGTERNLPHLLIQHVKALTTTDKKAKECQIVEAMVITGTLVTIKSHIGVKMQLCSCA